MALPATAAGITQMESLTTKQMTGGCAFACHQANASTTSTPTAARRTRSTILAPTARRQPCNVPRSPSAASSYAKACCDTTKHDAQLDNYALARKNNITLRLDELNSGVSTLLADRIDDRAVDRVRDPAEVSIFDLLDG